MRINISQEHYLALNKAKITLNCLYILEQLLEGVDISGLDDMSTLSSIATLQRKGYIDMKLIATDAGRELYQSLDNELVVLKKIEKPKDGDFDRWWLIYPQSDEFEYKGRKFKGAQSKRIKKTECIVLFTKLVNSGLKPDDIINATEYHINNAKNISYNQGKNQLTFIPNSERYLRERCFEPFIGKGIEKEKKTDLTIEL